MTRYVTLYGGVVGMYRRLAIREAGAHLVLQLERKNAVGAWIEDGEELAIETKDSGCIGNVAAALATIWDTRRVEELERRAKGT